MNTPLFGTLIYLLGFIGLILSGLIPCWSWQESKKVLRNNPLQIPIKESAAFAVLTIAGAIWAEVQITERIFERRTDTYGGPRVASGLAYMVAVLDIVYLAFYGVILVNYEMKVQIPRTL